MSRNNIPSGFKKMGLELTMTEVQFDIFKKDILKLLLRDWIVYYSAKKYSTFYKVFLYCELHCENSVTYTIGCYCQCMFNFYSKNDIEKSNHTIPENYLHTQLIENQHG